MNGWQRITGTPARLEIDNIDTDQLIPARFMSRTRAQGYGSVLLHDLREQDPRAELAEGCQILIAGQNFGCGSSREAAVYALVDFGIRAVLAPSFGDIFAANAVNNGLLPATIPAAVLARLRGALTIDLDTQEVRHDQGRVPFDIDPVWRTKLMNGWDDIDLTTQYQDRIDRFKSAYLAADPWRRPRQGAS